MTWFKDAGLDLVLPPYVKEQLERAATAYDPATAPLRKRSSRLDWPTVVSRQTTPAQARCPIGRAR